MNDPETSGFRVAGSFQSPMKSWQGGGSVGSMKIAATVYPLSAVRTLALHAQGLAAPIELGRLPRCDAVYNVAALLGGLQIDTLQRVHRSHYLTVWSRLGRFDPHDLDRLTYGEKERRLFEYWFHGVSLIPLTEYRHRLPMMRWYRDDGGWNRSWLAKKKNRDLVRDVRARVEQEGPLRTADFKHDSPRRGAWWDWKPAKRALEVLYNRGELMISNRVNFQRVYDLRERVLPEWVDLEEPSREETDRYVLSRSARSLGICFPTQIADYTYDLKRSEARPILEALIHEGILREVRARMADGDVHSLVVHHENLPLLERAAEGDLPAARTTFLNPFDPLFYPRGRDVKFWKFEQVLEAYKPSRDRRWGYYCLPILHGDRLVGRFDPKLDRKTGVLKLEALFLEDGVAPEERLVVGIADAMRDFMAFHDAHELQIEYSQPEILARKLMKLV